MPLACGTLMVPNQDQEVDPVILRAVRIYLVSNHPDRTVIVYHHLRRKMCGIDIDDPFRIKHIDQMLGNQFPDMPDPWKSLEHDRRTEFNIVEDVNCDITRELRRLILLNRCYGLICHCCSIHQSDSILGARTYLTVHSPTANSNWMTTGRSRPRWIVISPAPPTPLLMSER
uniref:Uncharacterized protein n=1 Tax=Candidatus Methanogaster sp. ANME-2c ERB4 TaxID=2759911 RepID=A0A7G9Y8T3_9EURY|nr:hypothetical protein LDEIPANE_00009 [Methanosarcinales archaeon ANME-2c ERB4]